MNNQIKKAEQYIDDAMTGKVEISKTTRLTFERHRYDLDHAVEKGIIFNKRKAERFFAACKFLMHSPDKRSWIPFDPEPWQAAIVYIIFGWEKLDGTRRFNYAYIELPKKNGKTTFAAVSSNYLLFFDGEQEAEIYHAATVEKQAHICFDKAKSMIEKSPELAKRARCLTNNVSVATTGSKMEPLGRDSESMEGINPSGAVVDEYHVFSWKNNIVFENIQSATVNRKQPLVMIITTAGRDKDLPCFEYHNLCIDILKGIKVQDDTFAVIYTIDEDDDWKDPDVWKKANPNWAISVLPERFETEFKGAVNSRTKEVSFKTKNLNMWVDAPDVWIPDENYMASSKLMVSDYGILDKLPCYGGMDLASHLDLNSLSLFFPGEKVNRVRVWFWIPEAKVREFEDNVDYRRWAEEGYIIVTPGSIIDIDQMTDDVVGILKFYKVVGLGYDPWHAHHGVVQNLLKGGIPVERLDPYSQSLKNMSAPTKEFEKMVMSGCLEHFHNPVLRWNVKNTVIRMDQNENIAPDKRKSAGRIDGLVATVVAIGEYLTLTTGVESKEIYKEHTLRIL